MKNHSENQAIVVDDIYKSFKLPHEQHSGLKQLLITFFRRKKGYEIQRVLRGVSFEVKKGEFFGIVGRNGSGKSTLLKLIAGIYTPNKGSVKINGSLTPFIELGVGFNPDLTGRENVFLNGALLGFSNDEMKKMYRDIVEFAELERFMDQRLKNYSSGMQVRLAFSIAIRANTDILVLDEVLAVGDNAFQQKCFDYFASLKGGEKTVILVSHSMTSIERFCDRAMLVEKGKVLKIGKSSEIATLYENLFLEDVNDQSVTSKMETSTQKDVSVDVEISQNGRMVKGVAASVPFEIIVAMKNKVRLENINVGINIRNAQGGVVFSTDMRKSHSLIAVKNPRTTKIVFKIENYYTNGGYTVDTFIVNEKSLSDKLLYKKLDVAKFEVIGVRDHVHSLFHPPFEVTVDEE